MEIEELALNGVSLIKTKPINDERGIFIKIFHEETYTKSGLRADFKESYYSISSKDVIRGMHFQSPPKDHAKIVYVTKGSIIDVILDLRKGSKSFGDYISIELSENNRFGVYIPTGFAHGFLSLENNTSVTYLQTSIYSPEHDKGIHFDSFGMKWGVKNPIISSRDSNFPLLNEFESPFNYQR